MEKFYYLLEHDKGTTLISTVARDPETGKKMIMAAEGCPESAITYKPKRKSKK